MTDTDIFPAQKLPNRPFQGRKLKKHTKMTKNLTKFGELL